MTAVVLAWVAFARHPVGDYFTETDFYGYAWGARSIQRGQLDFSRYSVVGPVYELLLAALSLVVRDPFRAGELISIASATGVLLLWAAIVRRRAGETAALWTVLFIAANPAFLRYGYSATTDMLAVCLQSAAVLAILGGQGSVAPLRAGVLTALAVLARYSAIYLIPAAVACYGWPGIASAGATASSVAPAPPSGRARPLAFFAAGFAILALPWLAFSLRAGHLPGSNLVTSFSYYLDPSAGRNVQDAAPGAPPASYRSLWDLLRAQPGLVLGRMLGNVPDHLALQLKSLIGAPVAAVCGVGLLFSLLDGAWRRLLPVGLTGALLFASLTPVFHSDRYALPLLPFYLTFAGVAVGSRRFALRVPPGLALKPLAALVPLALSLQSSVAQQRWVASQLPVEVIPAGEALRRAARADPVEEAGVLSRKMHLWYYSGLNPVAFPRLRSLAELADHCRRNGARYLYFSWYEGELRPEFWYLLDTTATVPGLARIPFAARNPAVLYRIGPEFGRDPDWLANADLRALHDARARVRALNDRDAWSAHLTLGDEARSRGDSRSALEHYLAVTRGNPGLALGWQRSGDALLGLGRFDAAREAYERARRLAPTDVPSRIGIGWTQWRSGRADLAAQTWAPLVGETRDPLTLRAMAAAFERAGDAQALAAARRALAALPK